MSAKAVIIIFKHLFNISKLKPEHSTKTSFVFSVIFPVNFEFIIGGMLSMF